MKLGDNYITDSEPLTTQRLQLWSELDSSYSSSSLSSSSSLYKNNKNSSLNYKELKDINYIPFIMKDKSIISYILFIPQSIYHSLSNMAKVFTWNFIFSVFIIYGFQQGLGNSWLFQARDYYFKDIAKVQPADAQTFIAISMTPWNLKPIYGMLSDSIPIFGYHRIPYIIIAGLIGCVCFSLLSAISFSPMMAVILLFGVNLSVASPDVMVDGLIAEKSREFPPFATDLQSLCWGCMSLFSISGYLTSGFMITSYGPIYMFKLLIISSIIIIIAGSMNWFGDVNKNSPLLLKNLSPSLENPEEIKPKTESTCFCGLITVDKSFLENHTSLFFIGTFIPFLAILLSIIILFFPSWQVRLTVIVIVWFLVVTSFYSTTRSSGLPAVANAGLFIFLSSSLTPDVETAMFYWYTNSPDGPMFTPQFVGYISGIAYGAMFLGILIYNRYLSSWKYRTIFASTMLFLACMGLIDVILVKRWNLSIGIPDEVMILGDSALSPMARRFYIMPLFILAAKVCPEGAEATVFSLLTALSNFGSSISVYSGSLVLYYFDVKDGNYQNLVTVILIKCCCRLLPIFLIPFLIPDDSPYPSNDTPPLPTRDKADSEVGSSILGEDGSINQSQSQSKSQLQSKKLNNSLSLKTETIVNKLHEISSISKDNIKNHKQNSGRNGYVGIDVDSSEHSLLSHSNSSTGTSSQLLNQPVKISSNIVYDSEDEDYDGILLPTYHKSLNRNPFDSSNERRKKHIDQVIVSTKK